MIDSGNKGELPESIIDAHHHLWNPVSGDPDIGYVWLKNIGAMKPFGDPTPIQRDYLIDEFLAESTATRLAGSIHVQADGAIADPVAETAFIQKISAQTGFPISIVGFVNLAAPDAEEVISRHKQFPGFVGARQILSYLGNKPEISFAPEEFLDHPLWQKQFELLKQHRLTFDLQLYPKQMSKAAEFLSDYPTVPIIIDHTGSPYDQSDDGMRKWRLGIEALANLPNMNIKISGLGMFDANWNDQTIAPMMDHIAEVFGITRIMFGSNYPVDKLMRTYDAILSDIVACFSKHGDAALKSVFHDNAKRIYRL